MGAEPANISQLLAELKTTRRVIEERGLKSTERMDELERSLNEVLVGQRRPSAQSQGDDRDMERKSTIAMRVKRGLPSCVTATPNVSTTLGGNR